MTLFDWLDKDPDHVWGAYLLAFIIVLGFSDWLTNRRRW